MKQDARKTFVGRHSRGKGNCKASGQSLRLQWRTFAADIMAGAFTKTVIDATMCAIIA